MVVLVSKCFSLNIVLSLPPGKDMKGYKTESIFNQPKGSEVWELKASSNMFSRSSEKASVGGEGVQFGRVP